MAGTWPNLDCGDLVTRVRTYLNEVTSDFYTDAEVYRWLSVAAKDIAQKTLCVRRILDAVTASGTRNVTTSCYKVLHVEYIPATGRPVMLTKIDPLKLGHYPGVTPGTSGSPIYWYEFGSAIGIDPLPDAVYDLRLYVADLPKMQIGTFPITDFSSGWTAGAGTGTWTMDGTDASFSGTNGQTETMTWDTALVATTNYTITWTLSAVSAASHTLTAGGVAAGITFDTNGVHSVNITTSTTASIVFTGTSTGTAAMNVDDVYILKEADFAAVGDQTELDPAWQHLLCIYATYGGLTKDRKYGPAQMLQSIYNNELAYLRQALVEVIPDGRNAQKYQ